MQITEGKFYKTRDGRKVGPMFRKDDDESYKAEGEWQLNFSGVRWPNNPQLWNRDGSVYAAGPGEDVDTLIEEWTEPTATPAPAGPVRMVRQIVPGVYGRVWVGRFPDGTWKGRPLLVALIEHDNPNPDRPPFLAAMNADDLRSAAMVFSQLAEALDDQP